MGKLGNDALNSYMLNAKFLLIVFVVIANCTEPFIHQNAIMKTLYLSIYTFHIPMFVMVTGYFSSDFHLDRPGIKSLQLIFYQYFLFQSIYSLLDVLAFHAPGVHYSFFIPYSLLWFLFSHFCWRLLLLLFTKLQHPIAASVILGVMIGYVPFTGTMLSLSRTLVFFPFFLAGYYFRLDLVPKRWLHLGSGWLSMVCALCIIIVLILVPLDPKLLYSSCTYLELGIFHWFSGAYRIGIYVIEIAASSCFLSSCPTDSLLIQNGANIPFMCFCCMELSLNQ